MNQTRSGVVRPVRRREMLPYLPPFSCDELRAYLEKKEDAEAAMLLLDCRSFLAYNDNHVLSAINAYCPSILRRRARDKLPLNVLIPSMDVREKITGGHYAMIVLYEENPASVTAADDLSAAIKVVSRCLQQDAGLRNLFYLDGGFQRFRQKYAHLCVGSSQVICLDGNGSTTPSPTNSPQQQQSSSSNPVYEQGDPVEILPHLFLGSAFHAANQKTLERLGVTALLNVSRTCPNLSEGRFAYKSIPVDDSNSADISSWFNEAIEFIDDIKANGGKVLVHCHAGISRSATICLAYMMYTRRIRLDEAYEYVKTRRNIISPNFNFMGQLLKFESQLLMSPPSRSGSGNNNSKPTPYRQHNNHYHQYHDYHRHFRGASPTTTSPVASSPLATFVNAVAATRSSGESCLMSAQRFVFDLSASSTEEVHHFSPVTSSTSPLLSPMCPIMSPS